MPMSCLDKLAERRIAEAIERGELSGLPGEGLPLALDDDPLVPAELRTAYRLLKNAGYVPPEVECLREIGELERLIERSADQALRDRAARRLELIWQRLALRSPTARAHARLYRDRLLARMAGERPAARD
jgi:hypothetical protein